VKLRGSGLFGIYLPHFQNHGAKSASDVGGSIADFAHRRTLTFPGDGSGDRIEARAGDPQAARESTCEVLDPHAYDVGRRELSVTVKERTLK
jgi:hypothetical protein